MNRITAAVILLITVTVLSATALVLQYHTTSKLIDDCDRLIATYQSGDIDTCRKEAQAFSDGLKDDMRLFPFFLRHERMETVFQEAAALPYLISDDDHADFFSSVSSLRMQLEILMDNEWPTPENIL